MKKNKIQFKGVDYKALYTDLIKKKCPDKMGLCEGILKKEHVSVLDAIKLNDILFPQQTIENERINQKHKSYQEEDIREILSYQKLHNLSNSQIALKFKMSRNTVTRWKRIFTPE